MYLFFVETVIFLTYKVKEVLESDQSEHKTGQIK